MMETVNKTILSIQVLMEIEFIFIQEVVTFGMLNFWNCDEKDGEINQRYNFLTNPKFRNTTLERESKVNCSCKCCTLFKKSA